LVYERPSAIRPPSVIAQVVVSAFTLAFALDVVGAALSY
jgi:hypothetical protein